MKGSWKVFENIVRRSSQFNDSQEIGEKSHPFEIREVHRKLPDACRKLFDDGHYSQSTFEACKYVDTEVQRLATDSKSGTALMMSVFGGAPPKLKLTPLSNQSEVDEQEGYKFIFAGVSLGIRNPRGHKHSVVDDPDTCLDHLGVITALLNKLEAAGFALS